MTDLSLIQKYVLDVLNAKPDIIADDIMSELTHVAAGRKNGEELFTSLSTGGVEMDWIWLRLFLLLKREKETTVTQSRYYDVWAEHVKHRTELDDILDWGLAFASDTLELINSSQS